METFLDEKDISTGESIDEAIDEHLNECDEILILLSPAALASHWVLMEIGGAKALGKRLIPILLHVGPNDLPPPLGKGLARDINDVEKYFEEIKKRAAPETKRATGRKRVEPTQASQRGTARKTASATSAATARRRRTFKVGDLVKIPDQPQMPYAGPKGNVSWKEGMDTHLGKTATVIEVDTDRTVKLDCDAGVWWWAMDWLELGREPGTRSG